MKLTPKQKVLKRWPDSYCARGAGLYEVVGPNSDTTTTRCFVFNESGTCHAFSTDTTDTRDAVSNLEAHIKRNVWDL